MDESRGKGESFKEQVDLYKSRTYNTECFCIVCSVQLSIADYFIKISSVSSKLMAIST